MFGFSKLDVMFGRTTAENVLHRYADLVKPGVRFVQAKITSIDPRRSGSHRRETFEADILVVALGADLDPAATPGLVEGGHRVLHRRRGVRAARRAGRFHRRAGGRRRDLDPVQVPAGAQRDAPCSCTTTCGSAGCSTSRQSSLVMPLGVPIPPSRRRRRWCWPRSPSAASTGIRTSLVRALDGERKVPTLAATERDGLRPVPRGAGPPRAGGRARVRADHRRLDRRRPAHAGDLLSRASTRSGTSPASARRRPASSPKGRRWSSPSGSLPGCGRKPRRAPTTATACATWNSGPTTWPRSTSPSAR